jgi:hypothetical protein
MKMSSISAVDQLPKSWARYLWSSERRLFLLAGLSKVIYSAGLIGVTMLVRAGPDPKCNFVTVSQVLALQRVPRGSYSEALRFCFGFLGIASALQLAAQGNSHFSAQLSGKIKARLAARISEHAILRASPAAEERALALVLASSDAHQVCEGAMLVR